jgi:putative Mg2+ transporter-C (MgtC) family protein
MSEPLTWTDVAVRLALTIGVSLVIGYNRREHGKAAGMRTTLLVCLAASVAMIQVNLLLPTAGRHSDSFIMNDLMRLPLGILTGVGFIGGGVILRRGDSVIGITTAATLWLVTVIGLCLGGGQIALGLSATGIGLIGLWILKWIEERLPREHRAHLTIELDASGPDEMHIRATLTQAGLAVLGARLAVNCVNHDRKFVFQLRDIRPSLSTSETPAFLAQLASQEGIKLLYWDAPQP